jgi:hypothetical protein
LYSAIKPVCIEVLETFCFGGAKIDHLLFAPDSRLRRIEGSGFLGRSFEVVCIPRSVEFVRTSCFNPVFAPSDVDASVVISFRDALPVVHTKFV